MAPSHPKTLNFAIPLDLHLIGRLRLDRIGKIRAYFDEAEDLAKKILRTDEYYLKHGRRPIKPEALDRMKRIAYVILRQIKVGRGALKKKNKVKAQGCANEIPHLRAELWSEPDRMRGHLFK